MTRTWRHVAAVAVSFGLIAAACGDDDDDDAATDTEAPADTSAATEPAATEPADTASRHDGSGGHRAGRHRGGRHRAGGQRRPGEHRDRHRRRRQHDQDRPQRRPVGHLRPARDPDRRRPGGVLGDRQRQRRHRRSPGRARRPRQRLRRADAPRELRGDVRRRARGCRHVQPVDRLAAHHGHRRPAGRGRPHRHPAVVVLRLAGPGDRPERVRGLHQLLRRVDERRDAHGRGQRAPTPSPSSPSPASTARTAPPAPRSPPRRSGWRSCTTARQRSSPAPTRRR